MTDNPLSSVNDYVSNVSTQKESIGTFCISTRKKNENNRVESTDCYVATQEDQLKEIQGHRLRPELDDSYDTTCAYYFSRSSELFPYILQVFSYIVVSVLYLWCHTPVPQQPLKKI